MIYLLIVMKHFFNLKLYVFIGITLPIAIPAVNQLEIGKLCYCHG